MSGVAHNGVESIDVAGQEVLILGAGPIGLLAAQCANALGWNVGRLNIIINISIIRSNKGYHC